MSKLLEQQFTTLEELRELIDMFEDQDPLTDGQEYTILIKSPSKPKGEIKELCEALIKQSYPTSAVLLEVIKVHPDAKTSKASIGWYSSNLNKTFYYPMFQALRKEVMVPYTDKELLTIAKAYNVQDMDELKEALTNHETHEGEVALTTDEDASETPE